MSSLVLQLQYPYDFKREGYSRFLQFREQKKKESSFNRILHINKKISQEIKLIIII